MDDSYGCSPMEFFAAPHIWLMVGVQCSLGTSCWYGLVREESKFAMLRPDSPMYSKLAVPPPYPEDSIRPDVVFCLILRMFGMESLLTLSPGTRDGSEKDSDST